MNQQQKIEKYKQDWERFRQYCENKAKAAECYINNKGWHKLREYHLENYLSTIKQPYSFLFVVKYRHTVLYRSIKCMPKIHNKYAKQYREQFDSPVQKMVTYPSWRGFLKRDT